MSMNTQDKFDNWMFETSALFVILLRKLMLLGRKLMHVHGMVFLVVSGRKIYTSPHAKQETLNLSKYRKLRDYCVTKCV